MALTMTRTRTQTVLSKLVELVANINGELEFLDGLLAQENPEEIREQLLARQVKLNADKAALFVTIRQFDPGLEPVEIGVLQKWRKEYVRKGTVQKPLLARYFALLAGR